MKICICTTPIRPEPTTFPPFGSMDIIQSLRKIGEEVHFYNIDYFRPEHEQIRDYFAENRFDVVGISAVVSTAYAYTKYLSKLIREVSPQTVIVVGGNLAASAEILLRKSEVDFCVSGDGELVIQDLVRALYEKPWNYDRLKETKGICFLDEDGWFYFTGYGSVLSADELKWPDNEILEADGSLPHFISDTIAWDRRTISEAEGKRFATVVVGKGCVARCTFCHRWERGYRALPVDDIVEYIRYLQDRYNVGFISMGDENFGSDRKQAWALATHLGELGIVWRAGGVRARAVTPEVLGHWKANGCTAVYYGIESGSQTMLDVMEKNTTVQMNVDALRWTYEAGLFTIIQLVVGMPGETDQTIRETIAFLKQVSGWLFLDDESDAPSRLMSINYAQALPGTPLYEYARQHRFIGGQLDDEEAYLLRISDTDAYQTDHFINYTGQPLLKVHLWRHWMIAEVDAHYIQQKLGVTLPLRDLVWYYTRGFIHRLVNDKGWIPGRIARLLPERMLSVKFLSIDAQLKQDGGSDYARSGYFNIKPSLFAPLFLNSFTRRWFYPLLAVAVSVDSADSPMQMLRLIVDHLRWSVRRRFRRDPDRPDKSLRKVVQIEPAETAVQGEDMMIPLRLGR